MLKFPNQFKPIFCYDEDKITANKLNALFNVHRKCDGQIGGEHSCQKSCSFAVAAQLYLQMVYHCLWNSYMSQRKMDHCLCIQKKIPVAAFYICLQCTKNYESFKEHLIFAFQMQEVWYSMK